MADNDITKRIFVKGFNRETTESDLRSFFEEYGLVKESKIVRDKHGISKGYAFITFESQDDADQVRENEALDFKDKKLSIGKAIRRKSGRSYTRHYHRQELMHEGAMAMGGNQLYYSSGVDGNAVYYPIQQPQYLALVPTPPYSPQITYQTQGLYSPQSHSSNLFSPTTMMGGSYMPASLPMQWNDYAAGLNRVRPIPTHQESVSEIAVSTGQATQIVGVAISDGNYALAESAAKGEPVAQLVAIDPTKMKGDKPIPVRFLKHE
ncbi:hypothetical protein QZH41_015427 [Actinostola sp. cb2023]|nr:hypothetical protein QZH41_008552 [Actinostola sp. cb2023]KAK3750198.1 hypothetical protein QZH41_015427 [Actinostola sp. cb2023]